MRATYRGFLCDVSDDVATFLPRTYRNLESTRGERHPRRVLWGGALTFIVTVSGKQWFLQRFTQYPIANERFAKKSMIEKTRTHLSSRNVLLIRISLPIQ